MAFVGVIEVGGFHGFYVNWRTSFFPSIPVSLDRHYPLLRICACPLKRPSFANNCLAASPGALLRDTHREGPPSSPPRRGERAPPPRRGGRPQVVPTWHT